MKVDQLRLNPAELNPKLRGAHLTRTNRRCVVLHHNENGDPNAGVKQVEQKILSIDVVDVAFVGIGPAHRPDIYELKAVAAILKLRLTLDNYRSCGESMAAAKVSAELVVGNVAALAPTPGVPRLLFRMSFLLLLILFFFLLILF